MNVIQQEKLKVQDDISAPFGWCVDLLDKLKAKGIEALQVSKTMLAPAWLLKIESAHWGACAELARAQGLRWAANWAEDKGERLLLNCCLEKNGDYLVLRTELDGAKPELPSQTPHYPAADRCERHIQDLFGIRFVDHPDNRRWIRHQAWPEDVFPLRKSFPAEGTPLAETPPDNDYPFLRAQGASVYEIPVGPIHAGIIEPGHFRFQAVGETVLNLEERLGYVHKGIEKIAEGRSPEKLAKLAGRVSGDSTVGHGWAACMAMERAAGVEIPLRAAYLRAILAERERIINHLWDMGAICNDVGFAFAHYQFGRLRELWLRDNGTIYCHRLMMDQLVPGGVKMELSPENIALMNKAIGRLRNEVGELVTILDRNSSLEDRLYTTGVLTVETAAKFGVLGYVGRASGQSFDVRRDAPYTPYDRHKVKVPVENIGDVASRFWVRYKEMRISLKLLQTLLDKLPDGKLTAPWQKPVAGAEGLGMVEGWRGEILCYVRFGADNRIARYYPRDPSVINWPALEKIILNNIVPDFPVCNKSLNGSYSGHDL